MPVRERDVRKYLHERVVTLGGRIEPIKYIGKMHCPDDLIGLMGRLLLVEGKRPGQKPRPGQERDHARWRKVGVEVYTVATFADVDALMRPFEQRFFGTNPWFVKPEPKPGNKVDIKV